MKLMQVSTDMVTSDSNVKHSINTGSYVLLNLYNCFLNSYVQTVIPALTLVF